MGGCAWVGGSYVGDMKTREPARFPKLIVTLDTYGMVPRSIGHPPHSSASPVSRLGPRALSGKKKNLGNITGEMSFRFSEYSSLRNSVFSQKSLSSSDVSKYVRCTVKFPFGRNGGTSEIRPKLRFWDL